MMKLYSMGGCSACVSTHVTTHTWTECAWSRSLRAKKRKREHRRFIYICLYRAGRHLL